MNDLWPPGRRSKKGNHCRCRDASHRQLRDCEKDGIQLKADIFPLGLISRSDDWPERDQRLRQWSTLSRAAMEVIGGVGGIIPPTFGRRLEAADHTGTTPCPKEDRLDDSRATTVLGHVPAPIPQSHDVPRAPLQPRRAASG